MTGDWCILHYPSLFRISDSLTSADDDDMMNTNITAPLLFVLLQSPQAQPLLGQHNCKQQPISLQLSQT